MPFFIKQLLALSIIVSLLSGCVVVPTFTDERTPVSCEIFTKSVDLEFIGSKHGRGTELAKGCNGGNDLCALVMIVGGGVFLSSVVISSSIYIVGNTAYYLEKAARCDDEELIEQQVTDFSKEMETIGAKKVEQDNIETIISEDTTFEEPKIKVLKFKGLDSTNKETEIKVSDFKYIELDDPDTEESAVH